MWQKAAKVNEVAEGGAKVVEINNQPIALFKVEGAFYAIDNVCHHRGGPLGEGALDGTVVTCPWHAWNYDVTTGECQTVPGVKQKRFPVKVEGEDILVDA
ncbi:MAG: Rieske (2Fe-2S) protein [Candidatus Omnitrophica bacterium]|nr:Rieske (2Fe-2S) protein [Candidatus Omnitrophota bacterium]